MYLNFIDQAAKSAFCMTLSDPSQQELQFVLEKTWALLEKTAKEQHYEVLECDESLREICNVMCGWLYSVPGARHDRDTTQLRIKDTDYGGSWQRRGGPGAFFAACRKWDRIENQIKKHGSLEKALAEDQREEGILDDLGDLRRYLILWEAWRLAKESQHLAIADSSVVLCPNGFEYTRTHVAHGRPVCEGDCECPLP